MSNCFDIFKSGFYAHHINTNCGKTTVLVLLDVSATFHTIDHDWRAGSDSGTELESCLKNLDFFVSIGDFSLEQVEVTSDLKAQYMNLVK